MQPNNLTPGIGMNKIALLTGFVIGILAALVGSYLFIACCTPFDFVHGIYIMKSEGKLGKIITLGSLFDLAAFGILLQLNKELMARGVILAVITMTLLTLFI
jgi:hypothetical protein